MKFQIIILFCFLYTVRSYTSQFNDFFENENNNFNSFPQQCSRNAHCAIGECCRSADGKVVISTFQFYPEIDWWRNQVGINPGNCTTLLAQEGEKCDLFCMCDAGLLCAPNVLCRTCGNICMSTNVVNKLIEYYDSGCNCIPTYFGPAPSKSTDFFGRSLKTGKYKLKIVNGVVQFPGV